MANRLAFLQFMQTHGLPARLLLVYFTGDQRSGGIAAPRSEAEWMRTLQAQDSHLGLPAEHGLSDRVHQVFLPVCSS